MGYVSFREGSFLSDFVRRKLMNISKKGPTDPLPPGSYPQLPTNMKLVGGFNPSGKYQSKWESSPNRGENKTYLKFHHLGKDFRNINRW